MKYILALLLLTAPVMADEIQTKDGKKIEFSVLTDQGDQWELTTPHGGKVTVKKTDFDKLIPSGTKEVPLTGASFTFDKKRKLETVDLLARIDPKRDGITGTWKFSGRTLVGQAPGESIGRLQSDYTPPEEYDLTLVAERVEGTNGLIVGLVGGGKPFYTYFDREAGTLSGLAASDGRSIATKFFEPKKPRTLVFMVRREAVIIQADGKDFIIWKADWSKAENKTWDMPKPNMIYLASINCGYAISKMVVTAPKTQP